MTRREGQFAGHGGLRLYWQAWLPEGEVRAAIVIAHGYGEHGGRYGNLVERLVPSGFALYAVDHRGHGRSEGPRGHVGRFAEFVADLRAFLVRVEEEQKGRPLFLLGHSMGGLIAVRYILNHTSGVDGLILSSPAFGLVNEPSRTIEWLARLLSRIAPRMSFEGNVVPAHLSRDATVGQAYVADPLVHKRATVRFFTEFKWAIRNVHERAHEIRMPTLVLQAGDDRLVDGRATESLSESLAPEVKEVHVYPGLFHELFNETEEDREHVLADLEHWLDGRLRGA